MGKNSTRMNTDEHGLVEEVKRKKEFSELPDSVVLRALRESGDDVKEARSLLRKYFGVFLTNRVLRGKGNLLEVHMSSKKRDYEEFYKRIFDGVEFYEKSRSLRSGISNETGKENMGNLIIGSVVDLGCGVNGFSYEYLKSVIGDVEYVGVEAVGQLVDYMNDFFKEKNFNAKAVCLDLFEVEKVVNILKKARSPRVVFMFQVIDALESMERDFSKKLILAVMNNCEKLVVSLPLVSLGGKKKFEVKRKWLADFLNEEFFVEEDFEMFGERILVIRKR